MTYPDANELAQRAERREHMNLQPPYPERTSVAAAPRRTATVTVWNDPRGSHGVVTPITHKNVVPDLSRPGMLIVNRDEESVVYMLHPGAEVLIEPTSAGE